MNETILVTGATGLVGGATLQRMLLSRPHARFAVLVRDLDQWAHIARTLHDAAFRVQPFKGDICSPGLGLDTDARDNLQRTITGIVHCAARTAFSTPLPEARAVNTEGTRNVLELAAACDAHVRFAYVSTAFVAGRRTGHVPADASVSTVGWVNGYEQSKAEAEQLVRELSADWVILRSSTLVCDDSSGAVTQFNAAHRALRLYRDGLAAMMPGTDGSSVDAVTTDYVSRAVAELALREDSRGQVFHLCAGANAIPLTEMLDVTYGVWAKDSEWKRRGLSRPVLADLATYALFQRTIEDTADASLKRVTRLLSHFVPQLGLPKVFDTSNTDAALGFGAPPVRTYWTAMVDRLLTTKWWQGARAA